jgi:SAM-dependent methyltransferase
MNSVSPALIEILRCPETGGALHLSDDGQSLISAGGLRYRLSEGVPVLLSKEWTPFDFTESGKMESSGFLSKTIRNIGKVLPPLDVNIGMSKALDAFFDAARDGGHCLVIGAGDNPGTNVRIRQRFSRVTITDIVRGPGVDIVCDGHALPLVDDCVDAVVVVAVLEHVLSPELVVAQITRVLKDGGVVYADTAFVQQVHMGRFDFTRFTDLGHRWLFRSYEEIIRANAGGPGAGLAWAITYFFLSFCGKQQSVRLAVRALLRVLFFWIHYFDYLLQRLPASRDAASGVIFVGRNRKRPLISPRDLIGQYRGGY